MRKNHETRCSSASISNRDFLKKAKEELPVRILLENIFKERCFSDINLVGGEKPDFKVTDNSNLSVIGIEHVRCYPLRKRHPLHTVKGLSKLCRECISELQNDGFFREETPYSITIKVPLKLYLYGYAHSKEETIKDEIKAQIGHEGKKSKYISEVRISYYTESVEIPPKISIHIQPDMLVRILPNKRSIRQAIKDKSKKLSSYKDENKDVTKWWLCLEIPHNSFISTIKKDLPKQIKSKYDGIYLVETNSGIISPLKPDPSI